MPSGYFTTVWRTLDFFLRFGLVVQDCACFYLLHGSPTSHSLVHRPASKPLLTPPSYASGACSRKTAFPTGKCAGVISMPGTMDALLLPHGSYSIKPRRDAGGNITWYPLTGNNSNYQEETGGAVSYWGRRALFPGST